MKRREVCRGPGVSFFPLKNIESTNFSFVIFSRVSPYILPAQKAIIYKAMIRSKMEYASSAWIGKHEERKQMIAKNI